MGTVGHNDPRDNWFWSDGNLDNQAWDDAQTVAATGRITQLTAYMAGDTGSMIGGPTLHDGAGNLLLYTAQSIARRSAPYSGGFDGTGRNPNDGYYINVYGFNYVFTDPSSFKVGAFRRSTDSWILGFDDHDANFGHLKTTGTSTPSTATGGNSWSSQAAGYSGGVMAYATYIPLGMFARVGGAWVPVVGKKYADTTTTYFETVMADNPINYWRVDEAGAPILDYGSRGLDLSVIGTPGYQAAALIVDPDKALDAPGANAIYGDAGIYAEPGPLTLTMEAWIKMHSGGVSHPGGGGTFNDVIHYVHWNSADRYKTAISSNGTDITVLLGSFDYAGICNNDAVVHTKAGCISTGGVHHVVLTYDAGPNFAGDNQPIYGGPCVPAAPGTAGIAKLYVDGVLVDTWDMSSFRPHINPVGSDPGHPLRVELATYYSDEYGLQPGSDITIDEVAVYDTVLSSTKVAHHYAVGTGSTGGTVAIGATYYVRNDPNTAWIALNMAALKQEMPERREFPVLEVWPDGRSRRLLGRWGEPETFGFEKGAMPRRPSGLIVPRQFALA